MADLYLVRHGQTELNVQNILQGWQDSPLTERGCEQALATRAAFEDRGVTFDHAYSSSLGRAQRTAELIVGEGRSIELVDDLREWHLGSLEAHQIARCRRSPGVIIRWPLVANLKASYGRAWLRRCPALWPDAARSCACGLSCSACQEFLEYVAGGGGQPDNGAVLHFGYCDGAFSLLDW